MTSISNKNLPETSENASKLFEVYTATFDLFYNKSIV